MYNNSLYSSNWLLNPIEPIKFFQNYWESQVLVINRNNKDYWQSLLSIESIDYFIASSNIKYPEISITNSKEEINSENYTVGSNIIDVLKLLQYYEDGSTIIFNSLQNYLPSLAHLCRAMEEKFSMPFQTNVYLTPPNSRGFDAHYDTHDVFILQISGSKHWRIYHRPINNPSEDQIFLSPNYMFELGNPMQEFDLHAGDLAYIPRGVIHDATTNKETSLHITLGALAFTWGDFFKIVLQNINLKDSDFRKSLPIGFARKDFDNESIHKTFIGLLNKITSKPNLEEPMNFLIDKFIASRKPILHEQFIQVKNILKFSNNSNNMLIIQRPNLIYRVKETSESIQIYCYGNVITFPINIRESISFVLNNKHFAINDIPGKIDFELKKVVVQRLIKEGLIMYKDEIRNLDSNTVFCDQKSYFGHNVYEYRIIEPPSNKISMAFEFISEGLKGKIHKLIQYADYQNFFTVTFGDKNHGKEQIDECVTSNNGDYKKIFATLLSTIYDFTEKYPNALICLSGSDYIRTRLLRILISNYLIKLKGDFEIRGLVKNQWTEFKSNIEYRAFSIKRNSIELKKTI